MDSKLESLDYDEEARDELRELVICKSISQRVSKGVMLDNFDSNSMKPLHDFLQILFQTDGSDNLLSDHGLPSDLDVHQFVNSLQNSFEELCYRISVKSHQLKS